MFIDRKDAGYKLSRELLKYKSKDVVVLGVPRGGVEVAYEVAKELDAELSIIVSRKLPLPFNPEAGFGAIAEDGSIFIREDTYRWLPGDDVKKIIDEQEAEIERRIKVLRGGEPLLSIEGKTVILVDDGLAMGSTMRVSISMCKNRNAKRMIVAVPVSGEETARDIEGLVDELVVMEIPPYFQAVAQVYVNWHDVSDEEVMEILKKWQRYKKQRTDKS